MAAQNEYAWISFYTELADKLRAYAGNRGELIEKIKRVYGAIGMRLPKLEKDGNIIDIDPFTVFGLFNKGITNANRITIISGFAREFSMKAEIPQTFDGIPVLNNQKATFYWFIGGRGDRDIDNLWKVMTAALEYADTHSETSKAEFCKYYDLAIQQKGVRWNMTMGLYWIRPYTFINLDSRNRWYIANTDNIPADFVSAVEDHLENVPSGEEYLKICASCRGALEAASSKYKSFPELSYSAWEVSETVNREQRALEIQTGRNAAGAALADADVDTVHYWIYSPGDGAAMWDEFYNAGIMAIGWGEIGDLRAFGSKDEMKAKMKETYDPALTYKNAAHATWQFANELKIGDVVFVKKGMYQLIGKGIVVSDYEFDPGRSDEYGNFRRMNWTHNGVWQHPGQAVMKTLTDITAYTEYVKKLNALFEDDSADDVEEEAKAYPPYTAEKFLQEVYMSKEEYNDLVEILHIKKNVILQGAPGVGKTYAAKRLAYSIMGMKDVGRVMMVQFHQSYSYEDFIMGYRPSGTGFELKRGAFYDFCKKAEIDTDNDYFFIIDEINRGNLSKIFGELLMLIENDKRGIPLQLLYLDEKFAVPENVYIIGMMNTADRSLAMLDYALRRRFAFIEMKPGFDTEGFKAYRLALGNARFDQLISCVCALNEAIADDESLGDGFCIGHSYFCNLSPEKADVRRLNSIVEYELIPLLKEYWFDEPNKVKNWSDRLRSAVK